MHEELIVFAEAAISSEPREAALDDPGQPSNLESSLLAFDNLELITVLTLELACELSALVPGISYHGSNVGERKTQATEQSVSGLAVRDVRCLNPAREYRLAPSSSLTGHP